MFDLVKNCYDSISKRNNRLLRKNFLLKRNGPNGDPLGPFRVTSNHNGSKLLPISQKCSNYSTDKIRSVCYNIDKSKRSTNFIAVMLDML